MPPGSPEVLLTWVWGVLKQELLTWDMEPPSVAAPALATLGAPQEGLSPGFSSWAEFDSSVGLLFLTLSTWMGRVSVRRGAGRAATATVTELQSSWQVGHGSVLGLALALCPPCSRCRATCCSGQSLSDPLALC